MANKKDIIPDIESVDLHAINKAQEAFETSIKTGDFDLMHKTHMQRDGYIQEFMDDYGRLPEQDHTSKRWR